MIKPDFMDLGKIEFGIEKEINVIINNFEEEPLEGQLTVLSRWIQLISEDNISLKPEEQMEIRVLINTQKTPPGKYWGDILLFNPEQKKMVYKKILVAEITFPEDRPEIEIDGNRNINFNGKFPVKVINNKIDFNSKKKRHIITIENKSKEAYLQGNIVVDEDLFWLEYEILNKRQLIIAPGKNIDIAIIANMEKLWEKKKEYAKGELFIVNNSKNLPEIKCSINLETSFDCPPYPLISSNEMNLGFLKPGIHKKSFSITNTGEKVLKGYVSTVDKWIEPQVKEFQIEANDSKDINFNLNIAEGLPNKEVLNGKLNLEFNHPSEIRNKIVKVLAKVDKRKILVKVSPEAVDLGNIVKGVIINKSFKIRHSDTSPIDFDITVPRGPWLKLITACKDKQEHKVEASNGKIKLNILPEEVWMIDYKINTDLCKVSCPVTGEIKIEAIKKDLPNKIIDVNLEATDTTDFLVDFDERPLNLGLAKPGESLEKTLKMKYLGKRADIKLVGSVKSLADWIKIEKETFEIRNEIEDEIKIKTSSLNSSNNGKKEGQILISYIPEKCFPSFETIPQQIETVIVNIKDEKKEKEMAVPEASKALEAPVVKKTLWTKIVGIPRATINYFRR